MSLLFFSHLIPKNLSFNIKQKVKHINKEKTFLLHSYTLQNYLKK